MADPLFPVPKSVKTLRGYYKDTLYNIDIGHICKELSGESDRAAIILVGALLEDILQYRIEQSIKITPSERQQEYLFRFEGPLGTFSNKIEISYIFGVIDKETARQLHIIREIRNACAHSKFKLSFEMPELSNAVKLLWRVDEIKLVSAKQIRWMFLVETPALILTLAYGSREKAIEKLLAHSSHFFEPPSLPDI